jgi:hypothetical protein
VDGRPLLYIYRPTEIPGCARVTDFWRELAGEAGLPGLYLVAQSPGRDWNPHDHGFDAGSVSNHDKIRQMRIRSPIGRLKRKLCRSRIVGDGLCRYIRKPIHTYRYAEAVGHFLEPGVPWEYHPMVVPNWDNTPRAGRRGVVLHGSTPELFRANVRAALQLTSGRTPERRLLFIKSWNEWAEGNHLEPDQRYGLRYLQVLREEKETLAREEGNRP